MTFNPSQQLAIYVLAQALIKADGMVHTLENVCWNTVALKLHWLEPADDDLDACSVDEALAVVATMSADEKRFLAAFFTMIVLADERLTTEEQDLLHRIITTAQMPALPYAQCPAILNEYL